MTIPKKKNSIVITNLRSELESQIKELKNRLPSSMTTALIEKQSKEIKELRKGIEKRLIAFSDWTMENEDSPNYVAHQDVKDYLSNFKQ